MMDWSKKELGLISRAAVAFDLPADVIGALPHLELIGDCQLLLGSHQGILAYSQEAIDINCGKLIVRLMGQELELMAMNDSELRVRGTIQRIELVR